jgi:hypothetical protein
MSPRGSAPDEGTSGLRLAEAVPNGPPSGRAAVAVRVTRWWTRVYTAGLPVDLRDARRAEVESDLWESVADGAPPRQILARLALGIADDLSWSLTFMDTTTRHTAGWSLGSLAVFTMAWLWLSQAPQSAVMRESVWAFPMALVNHLVGLVLLVGMRLPLDLRLMGWAFGGMRVSQLAKRTAPLALVGGIVTVISGMALYAADPARMSSNPMFLFKIAALAAALVNAWIFHAVLVRRVGDWDNSARLPAIVQASGYTSVLLWTALIVAGRLIAFTGN